MNEYTGQDRVKELKEDASRMRIDRDYSRALSRLDRAIEILDSKFPTPSTLPADPTQEQRAICTDRADCYGMKGGILRRMENPGAQEQALACYEAGLTDERLGGQSTYCLSNAIVFSILLGKETLTSHSLRARLSQIVRVLEKAVQDSLSQSRWAWADLGQFYLLSGRLEDALRCYDEYKRTGATERDFDTTLDILGKLAITLGSGGDTIRKAIERLQALRTAALKA
jgi:tetratricopeptide (TPR) repeat protein